MMFKHVQKKIVFEKLKIEDLNPDALRMIRGGEEGPGADCIVGKKPGTEHCNG